MISKAWKILSLVNIEDPINKSTFTGHLMATKGVKVWELDKTCLERGT